MTPDDTWSIASGPTPVECEPPSTDVVCFGFELVRGDEKVKITVRLGSHASAANPNTRLAEALRTDGRSEVARVLGDETPPDRISLSQRYVEPDRR